ncbi:MAG: hypothetical protein CL877_09495 [Dehalococcoidales bacterium]|nr:hypothetical protein [Dehalococcoidales bacterium]
MRVSAARSKNTCAKATRIPESILGESLRKRELYPIMATEITASANVDVSERTSRTMRQKTVVKTTPRMAIHRSLMIQTA